MWLMTSTAGADRWQRLGALLIQRRTALNPRYHNRNAFCEATGLKYRLVYDIEEHRRTNFGSSTLAAIEAAYQLGPGSIKAFLDGGSLEPEGAAPAPAATSRSDSGTYAEIDEIAAMTWQPLIRLRLADLMKDGNERPSGAELFREGGDPLGAGANIAGGLADAWDKGMERNLDLDTAVKFAARAWAMMAAYQARQNDRSSSQGGALVRT